MPAIKILGHRGSKHFPENTLPAFEDALKHADGFEFDVQFSKDEIPVVIHDDTVDRTTTGRGRVDSFTAAELKNLPVLGEGNKPHTDIHIPTLAEVLELADLYIKKRPEIVINIEIKDKRATAKTIALVKGYFQKGWKQENVIISSFDHEALKEAKAIDANIPLGVLYEPEEEQHINALIEALDPYAIHPSLSELESEVFDPTQCGKPLVVWIYGEKEYPDNMPEIRTLFTISPMILITNYPEEVKKSLL